jgi:hypothetical protein
MCTCKRTQATFARRRSKLGATLASHRLSWRTGVGVSQLPHYFVGNSGSVRKTHCQPTEDLPRSVFRTDALPSCDVLPTGPSLPVPAAAGPATAGMVCMVASTCPLGVLSAKLENGEVLCHNCQHSFHGDLDLGPACPPVDLGNIQWQPTRDLPLSAFRTDALPRCDGRPTSPPRLLLRHLLRLFRK